MQVCQNFFAIDGPNGVGKSTVVVQLKELVAHTAETFVFAKEPTSSVLGQFIREHQDRYNAETLAALVAANRYEHLNEVILPGLRSGKIVITDRYFASSLVYQVIDGLSYAFIHQLNAGISLPRHYFLLTASVDTIGTRLAERTSLTRFESKDRFKQEANLFEKAAIELQALGVTVHVFSNEQSYAADTARHIHDIILQVKVS